MATELNWKEKGFILRQETRFPGCARNKADHSAVPRRANWRVKLRVPYWAAGPVVAKINGKEAARSATRETAGSRSTAYGPKATRVELSLPMNVHIYHASDNPDNVAFMYGPIVLAGEMGRANFPADDHFASQTAPNNYPAPPAPVIVSRESNLAELIKPVAGKTLTFMTAGGGKACRYPVDSLQPHRA